MTKMKTPGVLTADPSLDAAIGDWKEVLQGSVSGNRKNKFTIDDALESYDEDEDGDFFDRIMKRDLGDDYMNLATEDEGDELDADLLKMFDSEEQDIDLDELMAQIDNEEMEIEDESDIMDLVQRPSAFMKIINFLGPGGRYYAIMKPLHPILLVAKEDPKDDTRRILLNNEERATILPRLESACQKDLYGKIIQ